MVSHRLGAVLAAFCLAGAPLAAQAPQTFNACYVPSVGAIYLVGLTGLPSACLAASHVAVNWSQGGALADGSVTAIKLADGAVVTLKLADGAVTTAKLAFDPATQAELDALAFDDGSAPNTGANLVHWSVLRGVPAAFADGVDNEGGAPANGSITTDLLADGAVTTAKVAPGTSVDLLGGLASAAFALAAHDHDAVYAALTHAHDDLYFTESELQSPGSINAVANPVDWSKMKGVPAGFADGTDANSGGTVTSIAAGAGLLGGTITNSGTVNVNFAGPGFAPTVSRSDHAHEAAGSFNTAVGEDALFFNTGPANTAVGDAALVLNNSGANNTALGTDALHNNTTGSGNTALGKSALVQSTGTGNIAVGFSAGFNLVSGGFNIYLQSLGTNSESGTIRIGTSPTHGRAFIAGIRGVTTGAANAVAVLIDANGQLGTASSSRRFKEDIQDMAESSRSLLQLRPVTFRYTQSPADGTKQLEYGLIAEEVEQVFPELVAYGTDGQVETVRYHILPALLLNELQRQDIELQRQERELVALRRAVAAQAATLEELRAELRRSQR